MGTRAAPRQPSGIELRWHGDPVSFLPPRLCATVSCFKNTVTIPSLRANRKDLGSCCCLSLVNHLSLTHLSLAFKEGWEHTDFRSLYNQGQLCLFFGPKQNGILWQIYKEARQDPSYKFTGFPKPRDSSALKADLYTTK